jgi:hypothetical protein
LSVIDSKGNVWGPTPGLANFRAWLEDFQSAVHGRAKGDQWTVNVGTGSQDLMAKVGGC